MAGENSSSNAEKLQSTVDDYFRKKADTMRLKQGMKVTMLRNKNFMVGFGLVAGCFSIYAYTMFSVRQGKLLEDFDKVVE